jgi:lysophospholipid acyltransferase (LPLAT)-like uncharacterized protein
MSGPTSTPIRRLDRRPGPAVSSELLTRVYGHSDLSDYPLKDRLIIRATDLLISTLIAVICPTLRWETRGADQLERLALRSNHAIMTFWHACIFTSIWFWRNRGIVVMSSRSRDAEYTGRVIKRYGYGTSRGSSSRGGGRALAEMAACLAAGLDVGLAIDGPRGPAYKAKPGAVTLARHSGQPIVPFHIVTRRRFALPSWDRLEIPFPFTSALTIVGEPIEVPRHASPTEIRSLQATIQASLDDLRRLGEEWRVTKRRLG